MNHSPSRDEAGSPDALVDAFQRVSRHVVALTAEVLASLEGRGQPGVTLPQYRALVMVGSLERTTPSLLADDLGVSRPAITRVLRDLSAMHLIRRQPDPRDRRQALLALSTRGRRVVEAVTRERERRLRPVVEILSARERRSLQRALDHLLAALTGPASAAVPLAGDQR